MPTSSSYRRLLAMLALLALTTLVAAPVVAQPPAAPGLPQLSWLAPLVHTLAGWLGMVVQPAGGSFDYLGCSPEPNGEPLCEPTE